jgi:hypothetical protein
MGRGGATAAAGSRLVQDDWVRGRGGGVSSAIIMHVRAMKDVEAYN